uniref:capZ-interacting protein isoform X2 n=1 Tax=Lonchura striata TaxID=40157 RepID=UPI000B4CAA7C|nr:capZ-interacting protein isoform X2 [Lonchura striata domestica]
MENRPAETNSEVDKSASPSVAQLAGKFKEQAANIPGKEKRSPNACPIPKVKVKSSPMIEKLQANLAFAPAALLPGVSPKSPGMKVLVSPFSTPPSTPTSPGTQSQPSETPVSFDQPPESTQLQFYNKVRTRGSIKRRPPSRRFRRSLSEYGDGEDLGVNLSSPENGAREDEVFGPNGKTEEVETGSKEQKKQAGSDEKPASRTGSSRSEDEEKENKEQKKQAESDEKPLSRRGSSRSEDGEKGKKTAEEITPCKNNTGNTKEEEVCHDGPGEENSSQPPSGNNEMCDSPQGEEQQSTACEQGKGDKEKDEAEAETKENSESTDTQRTSDTEETALAPEPLQDAVGLGTASEPSVSVTQDQGTA